MPHHDLPAPPDPPDAADNPQSHRGSGREVAIVLALSLAQSLVYAVLQLTGQLTAGRPVGAQRATLNRAVDPRPWLDLAYQLAGIGFTLAPVALVLLLLGGPGGTLRAGARRLGIDGRSPGRDLAHGAALAAAVGVPGLGLYLGGRLLGVTAQVVPAALADVWWAVPVLVLQAVKNAAVEEIVLAYVLLRSRDLRWSTGTTLLAVALLRGGYHLYQGFGPFVGNAVMGLGFGWWFLRRGRALPLVLAHTLIDVVAFVGYLVPGVAALAR